MAPFRMTSRRLADFVVIAVTGAVDTLTAHAFGQQLVTALEQCPRVVCDISTVEFFDSSGLGALVNACNCALAISGSLELVCSNPSMLRLFDITGLDGLFVVHRSLDDAFVSAGMTVKVRPAWVRRSRRRGEAEARMSMGVLTRFLDRVVQVQTQIPFGNDKQRAESLRE